MPIRAKIREAGDLLQCAYQAWQRDNAMMLAAAVAFYATFSLAPLLLLLIHGGALLFGEEAALRRLLELVSGAAGGKAARAVERLIEAAAEGDAGVTVFNSVVLVVGASAVFRQLKVALNIVLDIPTEEERGVMKFLKKRAFAVVVAIAVIALVLTGLGVTAASEWMRAYAPDSFFGAGTLWRIIDRLVFFAALTVIFAAILKFVPDIDLAWRHVRASAALAALLFVCGQLLLGLYLAHGSLTSAYGAAGSIVLLLVYVYFTVAVILAAAELSEVIARRDPEFRYQRRRVQDEQDYEPRKEEEESAAPTTAPAPTPRDRRA